MQPRGTENANPMAGEQSSDRFDSGEHQRQRHPSSDMSSVSGRFSGPFSGPYSSGEFAVPTKPVPPPGSYIVQLPKDQVYRVPPPENTRRYEYLSRQKPNRSGRCRRCICFFLFAIATITVLAAIAGGILYVVVRPERLRYTVTGMSIGGFNLTSSTPISPEFNVTVVLRNSNGRIGVYYENRSTVIVQRKDIDLGHGGLTAFYQPAKNSTVLRTTLKGTEVQLTGGMRKEMGSEVKKGAVLFQLKMVAPVRFKVGSIKTWKLTVQVNCFVTVDKLTAPSEVVNQKCGTDVDLW